MIRDGPELFGFSGLQDNAEYGRHKQKNLNEGRKRVANVDGQGGKALISHSVDCHSTKVGPPSLPSVP